MRKCSGGIREVFQEKNMRLLNMDEKVLEVDGQGTDGSSDDAEDEVGGRGRKV